VSADGVLVAHFTACECGRYPSSLNPMPAELYRTGLGFRSCNLACCLLFKVPRTTTRSKHPRNCWCRTAEQTSEITSCTRLKKILPTCMGTDSAKHLQRTTNTALHAWSSTCGPISGSPPRCFRLLAVHCKAEMVVQVQRTLLLLANCAGTIYIFCCVTWSSSYIVYCPISK